MVPYVYSGLDHTPFGDHLCIVFCTILSCSLWRCWMGEGCWKNKRQKSDVSRVCSCPPTLMCLKGDSWVWVHRSTLTMMQWIGQPLDSIGPHMMSDWAEEKKKINKNKAETKEVPLQYHTQHFTLHEHTRLLTCWWGGRYISNDFYYRVDSLN